MLSCVGVGKEYCKIDCLMENTMKSLNHRVAVMIFSLVASVVTFGFIIALESLRLGMV